MHLLCGEIEIAAFRATPQAAPPSDIERRLQVVEEQLAALQAQDRTLTGGDT